MNYYITNMETHKLNLHFMKERPNNKFMQNILMR